MISLKPPAVLFKNVDKTFHCIRFLTDYLSLPIINEHWNFQDNKLVNQVAVSNYLELKRNWEDECPTSIIAYVNNPKRLQTINKTLLRTNFFAFFFFGWYTSDLSSIAFKIVLLYSSVLNDPIDFLMVHSAYLTPYNIQTFQIVLSAKKAPILQLLLKSHAKLQKV